MTVIANHLHNFQDLYCFLLFQAFWRHKEEKIKEIDSIFYMWFDLGFWVISGNFSMITQVGPNLLKEGGVQGTCPMCWVSPKEGGVKDPLQCVEFPQKTYVLFKETGFAYELRWNILFYALLEKFVSKMKKSTVQTIIDLKRSTVYLDRTHVSWHIVSFAYSGNAVMRVIAYEIMEVAEFWLHIF